MMPVPMKGWQVRVHIIEDDSGPVTQGAIRLSVVLPTVDDIVQISDFKRLLQGNYHDSYLVTEIGIGTGPDRMHLKMKRVRPGEEGGEGLFASKPAVYVLGNGRYTADIALSPGGQIAQRKKLPAIPLRGDYLTSAEPTRFVSLDDPGFGSGDPEFPVTVDAQTLLRVVRAYHAWTWLRPGTLRDGTPRFEVEATNLSTKSEAALLRPPT